MAQHDREAAVTSGSSFPRAKRLSGKLAFAGVYENGRSQTRGPLKAFGLHNGLPYSRLGLSVSRRVGTAPRRNRIKRLLRESFRLMQDSPAKGYDLIIVVRPHEPLALAAYQKLLAELLSKIHAQFAKRDK